MDDFKGRLTDAIKAVFADINSLSDDAFLAALEEHKKDHLTQLFLAAEWPNIDSKGELSERRYTNLIVGGSSLLTNLTYTLQIENTEIRIEPVQLSELNYAWAPSFAESGFSCFFHINENQSASCEMQLLENTPDDYVPYDLAA